MKCENCDTNVDSKFQHAIKNNQCPACGKSIMSPESMASFGALKQLIGGTFPNVDANKLASLVVANFEVKQRFKDLPKSDERGNIDTEGDVEVVEEGEDGPAPDPVFESDPDAEHKRTQMAESKKILEKLRAQALDGDDMLDEADAWGLGNANSFTDKETMEMHLKKQKSQANFDSGSGAFRRG